MKKQTKETLDNFYRKEDPWKYKTNTDDLKRKELILREIKSLNTHFERALDLGAGEAWITKDLSADKIYGYEISDVAANRFPDNVERVLELDGKYDLILLCGVLYPEYKAGELMDMVMKHANGYIITCHIKKAEINNLPFQIKEYEFKYRQYTERIAIYDFRNS